MVDPETGSYEITQLRLQAILSEYQALRSEMVQKFAHHLQIYSIAMTAVTVMIGYVLTQGAYDLLLVVPLIAVGLAFRYLWEQRIIVTLGQYIRFVESTVLPAILGPREVADSDENPPYWVSWEHYFLRHFPQPPFYKWAVQLLFVAVPITPAVVFSGVVVASHFLPVQMLTETRLPIALHAVALALYAPAGVYVSWKLWTS